MPLLFPESIHLCDFPAVDEAMIDEKLERDMGEVLDIVVLGRAARNASGIKNRQPIGQMFVNGEAALTDYYKQIIEGELNVKDVIFKEDVSDLTDYTFKPQMRILGPKYGKDLGKIRNILANLNGSAAKKELDANGFLTIELNDGKINLLPEELLIDMSQKEGYVSHCLYLTDDFSYKSLFQKCRCQIRVEYYGNSMICLGNISFFM